MITETAVLRSITVEASPARAFEVFTSGMDSWWPRSHHIGKSPMTKVIVTPTVGGRVYSEQQDGSECQWGQILAWDPPHRFIMAWMITPEWQPESNLAKCSEVEVTFTAVGGSTRVDLEHRDFDRHGAGGEAIRQAVGTEDMGWAELLKLFSDKLND